MSRTKLNKHHKAFISTLKRTASSPFSKSTQNSRNYMGHKDPKYDISTGDLRQIAKDWVKKNKKVSLEEFTELLNSLHAQAETSTEKYLAGYLIQYLPNLRRELDPKLLDTWLEHLEGWGQVDVLCQSKFSAQDLLQNWQKWKELLQGFAQSDNISKRRASLVLLTKPVRDSDDPRIVEVEAYLNDQSDTLPALAVRETRNKLETGKK